MKDCENCVCLSCDANNKLHSTNTVNTCYGCDGNNSNCNKFSEVIMYGNSEKNSKTA